MKLFIAGLLFTLTLFASTVKVLIHENKTVKMKFEEKRHTYLSENCKDIKECFFSRKFSLKTFPNQSPGFSLCYQLGGEPFFGVIKGEKDKEPICKKGEYYANHEAILYYYRDHHSKSKP